MDAKPVDPEVLRKLAEFDTPTICNALERVAPERRARGFTTQPLVCARPELPPIVGYARTTTIRAKEPWAATRRPRDACSGLPRLSSGSTAIERTDASTAGDTPRRCDALGAPASPAAAYTATGSRTFFSSTSPREVSSIPG